MIISLIGMMGCGKSSVGKELSECLGCLFTDLDEEIEKAAGGRSRSFSPQKGKRHSGRWNFLSFKGL